MTGQDTTTLTAEFEIELTISGSPKRADPEVGLMSDYHEDVAVEEAVVLDRRRDGFIDYPDLGQISRWKTVRIDLCAGLDAKAKATVLSNLLEAFGEEAAAEALGEER